MNENWFYDHGTGAFILSLIMAEIFISQIRLTVGSFSTKTNTWNWSWNNNTTLKHDSLATPLIKVKAFGADNNFEQLTKGLFEGDEYTCIENDSNFGKIVKYDWFIQSSS